MLEPLKSLPSFDLMAIPSETWRELRKFDLTTARAAQLTIVRLSGDGKPVGVMVFGDDAGYVDQCARYVSSLFNPTENPPATEA